MSDIIYLSEPETPKTPIREQLLSFALSAMASPDMPDHWHMLIDFASFGDEIIFSDGEPDTSSIFVSCFRPGRWEIGTRYPSGSSARSTTWEQLPGQFWQLIRGGRYAA